MNDNKTDQKQAKSKNDKPNKLFGSLNCVLGPSLLESDFVDDMKQGVTDFINSANSTFASGAHIESSDLAKKMIKNLTDNLNNSFEHNYQTSIRAYSDLVHDIQQIANHNMKNTNGCFGK